MGLEMDLDLGGFISRIFADEVAKVDTCCDHFH